MNLFGYHGKALRQRVGLHDEGPGQGADQEGGDDGGDQPAEPPLLRLPGPRPGPLPHPPHLHSARYTVRWRAAPTVTRMRPYAEQMTAQGRRMPRVNSAVRAGLRWTEHVPAHESSRLHCPVNKRATASLFSVY